MLERQIYDWDESYEKRCIRSASDGSYEVLLNKHALLALLFALDGFSSVYSYGENSDMESNACARVASNAIQIAYAEIIVIPQRDQITDSLAADKRIIFNPLLKRLSLSVTRTEAAIAYEELERSLLKKPGISIIRTSNIKTGVEPVVLFGVMKVILLPDSAF